MPKAVKKSASKRRRSSSRRFSSGDEIFESVQSSNAWSRTSSAVARGVSLPFVWLTSSLITLTLAPFKASRKAFEFISSFSSSNNSEPTLEQEINTIKDKNTAQVLLKLEKRLRRLEKENKFMKKQLSKSPVAVIGDSPRTPIETVIAARPVTPIMAGPPPPPPPPPPKMSAPPAPVFKVPISAKPASAVKKPAQEKSFSISANDLKNIKLRSASEAYTTPVNSVPNSPAVMRPPQLVTLADLTNMKLRKTSPAIHNKFSTPSSDRELTGVRLRQIRKSPGGTPLKMSPLKSYLTPMKSARSPLRNKENLIPV